MKKNRNKLIFNVGPWEYRTEIVPGELIVEGNSTCVAWTEYDRAILISADCPPNRRLSMLMWGLFRAWVNHSGEPRDRSGWCELAATAMEQLQNDLKKGGGQRALMRMKPSKPSDTRPDPETLPTISTTEAAKRLR
jgi:hypothetical protein